MANARNSETKPPRPAPIPCPVGSPGPRTNGASTIDPQIAPQIIVIKNDAILVLGEFDGVAKSRDGESGFGGDAYGLSLELQVTFCITDERPNSASARSNLYVSQNARPSTYCNPNILTDDLSGSHSTAQNEGQK